MDHICLRGVLSWIQLEMQRALLRGHRDSAPSFLSWNWAIMLHAQFLETSTSGMNMLSGGCWPSSILAVFMVKAFCFSINYMTFIWIYGNLSGIPWAIDFTRKEQDPDSDHRHWDIQKVPCKVNQWMKIFLPICCSHCSRFPANSLEGTLFGIWLQSN